MPSGIGSEAAGVVERVGPGVTDLKPANASSMPAVRPASYASHRVVPAARLVKIPDGMSDETRRR